MNINVSIDIYCMARPVHALTLRSKVKGQGYRVMECVGGVGLHVDLTALVSSSERSN